MSVDERLPVSRSKDLLLLDEEDDLHPHCLRSDEKETIVGRCWPSLRDLPACTTMCQYTLCCNASYLLSFTSLSSHNCLPFSVLTPACSLSLRNWLKGALPRSRARKDCRFACQRLLASWKAAVFSLCPRIEFRLLDSSQRSRARHQSQNDLHSRIGLKRGTLPQKLNKTIGEFSMYTVS